MSTSKPLTNILIILTLLLCATCRENGVEERSYPVIDTQEVTEITEHGANLNGQILHTGTTGVQDHGFVYSRFTNDPMFQNSERVSLGETTNTGIFSAFVNRNLVKDTKYYARAYGIAKTTGVVVYGQVMEFVSKGGSAPEIVSFSPASGVIGDTIQVIGSGFSNVPSNNRVKLTNDWNTVVKSSSDTLLFIVHEQTTVGETQLSIQVGEFNIVAENKFTLKPMSLTGFSPAMVSFGDTIILMGLNFPARKELAQVTFLGSMAVVSSIDPTYIKAVVANTISQSQSAVSLHAGVQNFITDGTIKILPPIITSFSPAKATKDTHIILQGNNFNPITTNNRVMINGKNCEVVQASKTRLEIVVASGIEPGMYPISAKVIDQTVVSAAPLEIVKPVITNVSPLHATWGNTITITGQNFGSNIIDNKVTFNSEQATIIQASETELKVLVPNGLLTVAATIFVQAISVDNQITSFISPFTLIPPLINSFTPDEGKSNSTVTILGANFNPIPSNNIVDFGNHRANVISVSGNQLTVNLPTSLVDSYVNINLTVAGQSATSSGQFHLISAWRRVADYPGDATSSATAFAIGDYGYVTLGTRTGINYDKPCWRYSPQTDEWLKVKSFHLNGEGNSSSYVNQSSFVINGVGYVGLGVISTPRDKVMGYSVDEDDWFPVAKYGGGGRESAVGFGVEGFGYVTTGRNQSNRYDVQTWQFNPALNTWTRKADFPGIARTEAAGFSINNTAYLTTGRSEANTYFKELWGYNTQLDQWRELATLPGIGRWKASAFSIGNYGYVLGGASTYDAYYTALKDFWRYDVLTNTWTRMEDFPGDPNADAVVFVINGKAYFGTGLGGPAVRLKDFWEFDPSKL